MSFTTKVVDGLLAVFNGRPDAAAKHPEVFAYLKTWHMDESNEVAGVLVKSKLFVTKTELENLIIFFKNGEAIGWCLGKDVKRVGQEQWEKRYPNPTGVSEVVWEIPESKTDTVLHKISEIKGVLDYMRVYLHQHPPAPQTPLPPP